MPGERGNRVAQRHRAAGVIEVEDQLWRQVRITAGTRERWPRSPAHVSLLTRRSDLVLWAVATGELNAKL